MSYTFKTYRTVSPRIVKIDTRRYGTIRFDTFVHVSLDFLIINHFKRRFKKILVCPGEFHKLWNELKGIFKLYGDCFLVLVAISTGRSPAVVDRACEAKNFRGCCILVHHIVAAGLKLIGEWCTDRRTTVLSMIQNSTRNRPLHNFLYCMFYFLVPWVASHRAIRDGDFNRVQELDRLWLQLFVLTRKVKYARLVGLWHHTVSTLTVPWKDALKAAYLPRLATGGFCVGTDAVIEFINCQAKKAVPLGTRSIDTIMKAVRQLNVTNPLDGDVRSLFGVGSYDPAEQDRTKVASVEQKDIDDIYVLLKNTFEKELPKLKRSVEFDIMIKIKDYNFGDGGMDIQIADPAEVILEKTGKIYQALEVILKNGSVVLGISSQRREDEREEDRAAPVPAPAPAPAPHARKMVDLDIGETPRPVPQPAPMPSRIHAPDHELEKELMQAELNDHGDADDQTMQDSAHLKPFDDD